MTQNVCGIIFKYSVRIVEKTLFKYTNWILVFLYIPVLSPFCLAYTETWRSKHVEKISRRTACKTHRFFHLRNYDTLELLRTSNEMELRMVSNIFPQPHLFWRKKWDVNAYAKWEKNMKNSKNSTESNHYDE